MFFLLIASILTISAHATPTTSPCASLLNQSHALTSEKLLTAYRTILSFLMPVLELEELNSIKAQADESPSVLFELHSSELRSEQQPIEDGLKKLKEFALKYLNENPNETKLLVKRFSEILSQASKQTRMNAEAQDRTLEDRVVAKPAVETIHIPTSNGNFHLLFSPNSETLAISAGNELWFWNRMSNKLTGPILDLGKLIKSIAFTANGQHALVSGNQNNWIKTTENPPGQINLEHRDWIMDVRYVENGQKLLTASRDGHIRIWDMKIRQAPETSVHIGQISAIAVSSDEQTIFVGTDYSGCFLWNRKLNRLEKVLDNRKGAKAIAMSKDGQTVIASSFSPEPVAPRREVQIQQLQQPDQPILTLDAPSASSVRPNEKQDATALALSPNDKYLAVGYAYGEVWIWDLANLDAPVLKLSKASNSISRLDWSHDGELLAVGVDDGKLTKVWNMTSIYEF